MNHIHATRVHTVYQKGKDKFIKMPNCDLITSMHFVRCGLLAIDRSSKFESCKSSEHRAIFTSLRLCWLPVQHLTSYMAWKVHQCMSGGFPRFVLTLQQKLQPPSKTKSLFPHLRRHLSSTEAICEPHVLRIELQKRTKSHGKTLEVCFPSEGVP
mmetsp:Transcript_5886/g.36485  ORF Transcript_5886/g.36485 Transcript_5886/m.36485 type:complete len:155 (+) Transcript_5886:286-750(+)